MIRSILFQYNTLSHEFHLSILRFSPPEVTFTFTKEIKNLIFSTPPIYFNLGFQVDATVNFALVLTSKGIREAVEQKQPEKALKSIAIRDVIDGVDVPIVTFSIEVKAGISVSGKSRFAFR